MKFLFGLLIMIMTLENGQAATPQDPYLWLESVAGKASLAWVTAENALTLQVLQKKADYQKVYTQALAIYNDQERIAFPTIRGDYVYNFWQDGTHKRGIWRRMLLKEYLAASSQWQTICDIDALAKLENKDWVYKKATVLESDPDLVLLSLSLGGGDAVVVREYHIGKQQFVAGGFEIPESKCNVDWIDRDTLLVGTNFGAGTLTDSGYPKLLKRWQRHTPLTAATLIYTGNDSDVTVSGLVINTPQRQYVGVYHVRTFQEADIYIEAEGKLVKLDIPADASFAGIWKHQVIFSLDKDWIVADHTYLQGSLLSFDYRKGNKAMRQIEVILLPDPKKSIVSVALLKDKLLVNMLNNIVGELITVARTDGQWQVDRVETPALGTLSVVSSDDKHNQYFYSFNSFLIPTTLYYMGADQRQAKVVKQLHDYFDSSQFVAKQYHATSKDGTKVPYFMLHDKNIVLDGKNPTLLYGYGGFSVSMRPNYSKLIGTTWLAAGGVYVLANIRGGGEFGPQWHLAAIKEKHQNAFDDFIAVAEDLMRHKVTDPDHLGIQGGSNGGLLVAACFTQRPDLYNAVVCQVPLLDMKRFNKLLAGASWMAEYGNPDIAEEWDYIKKYSPYHNLSADKQYPKVLLMTSTKDDRVHPAHARKMVAKMKSQGHDVLYYENTVGGHAGATDNAQRAQMYALVNSYLRDQLGLKLQR